MSIDKPEESTKASAAERRAGAIRILLALVEVDPTVSGAALVLPDGHWVYLDVGQLCRGG